MDEARIIIASYVYGTSYNNSGVPIRLTYTCALLSLALFSYSTGLINDSGNPEHYGKSSAQNLAIAYPLNQVDRVMMEFSKH